MRNIASLFFGLLLSVSLEAQSTGTALVRHAPTLNGRVQGSIQQMTAENTTLNGGASVSGDLRLPGTPTVRLNGSPNYGGALDGAGTATPSNYTITLNGGASLGHLVRRTDPVALPVVAAPPKPTGTRSVSLNNSSQAPGDFATIKSLTLNGNVGAITVPPGSYGEFTANGSSRFTLGVAGAVTPAVYNFQHLTLNGSSRLDVVGPVIVTLLEDLSVNSILGNVANPVWLTLRISKGSLTLNGNATLYGYVTASSGTVTINGNSQLVGGLAADRLTLNGNSLLRLLAPIVLNPPPVVALTFPTPNTVVAAPATLTLTATASSAGSIAQVAFYSGTTLLGTATTPSSPGIYTLSSTFAAGSYSLTAVATDNNGLATTSAASVLVADAPPTVSLTSPAPGLSVFTPGTVSLAAAATSPAQTISKVEFYQGSTLLGASTSSPYQYAWINPAVGSCSLLAKAYDSLGITTDSAPVALTVVADQPPVITLLTTGLVFPSTGQVSLSFNASDAVTGVRMVEIYRSGNLVATLSSPASGSTWTFTESASLPPGTYSYWAIAYDTNGSFTDSSEITVTVLSVLPWTTDFETSEGYTAGSLQDQLGWLVPQGAASVTALDFGHGSQSVLLPAGSPPAILSQVFAPDSGETVEFFDFLAKPVAQSSPAPAATFTIEEAQFAFLQSANGGVLQVFRGDGTGGGTWAPTQFTIPLTAQNAAANWVRLTARLDFTQKTWDLYANSRMVAADEPFRDNRSTSLGLFQMAGDLASASGLDDIIAGPINPVFADVNNNGIDDAWETAHGLSLAGSNRNLSPTDNGVTVVQAYVGGTDPNDYFNGQTPQLTIVSGNHQTAPVSQFNDQPFVVAVSNTAGAPLVHAPVVFTVQNGGGKLALATAGNPALSDALTLLTDATGTVQASYQQPWTSGVLSTVQVSAGTAQSFFTTTSDGIDPTDTNNNGLPDAWEMHYFGHLGVDPNADDDGDGVSNLQEYLNGTDPTDFYNGHAPVVTSLLPADGSLLNGVSVDFQVTDQNGRPLVNAPVTFTALGSAHGYSPTKDDRWAKARRSVTVRTDGNGVARAYVVRADELETPLP